jgi:hypothetical protein
MGCHVEFDQLAGLESGQDHLTLYLRNGNIERAGAAECPVTRIMADS